MSQIQYKVLLVDDSPVIQTLVKKIFFGLGIEITGLKSGAKVLDTVKSKDFDLIIMDIILPDCDGLDLVKQIRKLSDYKKSNVPVICISGHYKSYTKTDFEELEIKESLVKPLDYDGLVATAKKYLK